MPSPIDQLHDLLIARGLTLSLAESCTGGLLSSQFTAKSGASKYFIGSVVSYNGRVKHELLGVPMPLLQTAGEVSIATAREMAKGVRSRLKTDWSVAVTGIAGPTGGTPEKPVGFVCFAVAGPNFEHFESQTFNGKDRQQIQAQSVDHAIKLLLKGAKHLFRDAPQ